MRVGRFEELPITQRPRARGESPAASPSRPFRPRAGGAGADGGIDVGDRRRDIRALRRTSRSLAPAPSWRLNGDPIPLRMPTQPHAETRPAHRRALVVDRLPRADEPRGVGVGSGAARGRSCRPPPRGSRGCGHAWRSGRGGEAERWLPDCRAFAASVLGWSSSPKGYAGTEDGPIPPEMEAPQREGGGAAGPPVSDLDGNREALTPRRGRY